VLNRGAAGGLASARPRWQLHQTRMQSIRAANEGAEIGAWGGCGGILYGGGSWPSRRSEVPAETEITEVNKNNLTEIERSQCI